MKSQTLPERRDSAEKRDARMSLPAGSLGHHDVLRVFDILRRRLARMVADNDGVFAGFDRLELLPFSAQPEDTVVCSARVIAAVGVRQQVAYEALLESPHERDERRATNRRVVVAAGVGPTVALRRCATTHPADDSTNLS